jgi:putative oxidoreductase
VSHSSHSLAYLLARLLLMALFLVSGVGKLGNLAGTQGYMETMGVPGILLWPTIIFEIGSGLCILLGFQTRLVAIVLAGFSLVTAFVFHHNLGDATQQIMFLKNLGLAGGFLSLACTGAGRYSIDGRSRRG